MNATGLKSDNPTLGIAMIIIAMFVFATQDAITKVIANDYSAPQILWIRFVLFAVFALAYSARSKPIKECFKSRVPALQLFRSILILVEIGMFIIAIRLLTLAEMHALFATFPLMVTAIAALFLREPVGLRRWFAVAICFVGVLIMLRPTEGALNHGALLGLATALVFALYNVLTRVVSRHDDSETSTVYMAVVGIVVLSALAPFFWKPPTPEDWLLLASLACTATVGHFLLIKALEAAPASTLQPFNYTLLVFATIIGYAVFGTVPDMWTITGAAIVVSSGLYTIYRERVRSQE